MAKIYKLKPIELHSGHRPGGYWTKPAFKINLLPINTSLPSDVMNGIQWGTNIEWGWSPIDWIINRELDLLFSPDNKYVFNYKKNQFGIVLDYSKSEYVLQSAYIPDQLIVFIYVHSKDDETTWEKIDENEIKEIENDILELGTLRMGFDENKFNFMFEDISFKVLNDSKIWDEILDPDVVSEIRILYTHPKKTNYNEPPEYEKAEGLFYGIIDKTNISFSDEVGPVDDMWERYREYEFTALNYMSGLKEVPILDLRTALNGNAKFVESSLMWDCYHGPKLIIDPATRGLTNRYMRFKFIDVATIIQTMIKLIYTGDINITVTSDIKFEADHREKQAGKDIGPWYLDTTKKPLFDNNIFILFERVDSGGRRTSHDTFWDGDGFDNKEELKTNYSFFHYENCLALLKNLLLSFGLVWRIKYTPDEQAIWKFKIDFNLISRFAGTLKNALTDDMHNNFEGTIEEESDGVVVTVLNYGNVTNSKKIIVTWRRTGGQGIVLEPLPQTDKMINLQTSFTSHEYELGKENVWDYFGQYLYGMRKHTPHPSDTLQLPFVHEYFPVPLDSYIIDYPIVNTLYTANTTKKRETYPIERYMRGIENSRYGYRAIGTTRGETSTEEISQLPVHKLYFGEMLANYYAGQFGIYSSVKRTFKFTVDSLDIEPLDIIPINDKNYIVMRVEKDFIDGSSKLTLKEYV